MLSIGTVVMGVDDLNRAATFWTRALGYVPKRPLRPEDDFTILIPESGGRHPSGTRRERILRQSLPADAPRPSRRRCGRPGCRGRSVDLARRHPGRLRPLPGGPRLVVLADPEGNRFCVIDTGHGSA